MHRSHAIGSVETESSIDDGIDVGSVDLTVSVGGNAVITLIIGEQEQEIGFVGSREFRDVSRQYEKNQASGNSSQIRVHQNILQKSSRVWQAVSV
jgi:hypothetical protein